MGKAKWGLRVTKAARIQKIKKQNKRKIQKHEVDVLHAISLCGMHQFLSCM